MKRRDFVKGLSAIAVAAYAAPLQAKNLVSTTKKIRPIADFHLHPMMKPYYTDEWLSPWLNIANDCEGKMAMWMVKATDGIPKVSQSNFERLVQGNVRIACASIVVMERSALVLPFSSNNKAQSTMECVTGAWMSGEMEAIQKGELEYFKDTIGHINYLKHFEHRAYTIEGKEYRYEIAKDGEHLKQILADEHKLAIVVTIEGGHALGHSLDHHKKIKKYPTYEDYVLHNADVLKGVKKDGEQSDSTHVDIPILSMGITHFFWNGLCGHARTTSNIQSLIVQQKPHINEGMSSLGKKVIERLLDKERGRRILIDVKHASYEARQWYYDYVKKKRAEGDNIPIVCTHTAIAGVSASSAVWNKKDKDGKNDGLWLNAWTLNMCNEDVQEIYNSDGLLGIMMDRYKLAGKEAIKQMKDTVEGSAQRKMVYVKVILANFLSAVKAIGKADAWNHLCIGTDFDGVIRPFETYKDANDFPKLMEDLEAFLANPSPIFELFGVEEIKELMFGFSAEEIVDKIAFQNLQNFIIKYHGKA